MAASLAQQWNTECSEIWHNVRFLDKRLISVFILTWCIKLINKLLTFFSFCRSHPHISTAINWHRQMHTHTRMHVHTLRLQLAGADKQSSLCLRAGMQANARTAEPTVMGVCFSLYACVSICYCVYVFTHHRSQLRNCLSVWDAASGVCSCVCSCVSVCI